MSKKKGKPSWPPAEADKQGDTFTVTVYAKDSGKKYKKCAHDEQARGEEIHCDCPRGRRVALRIEVHVRKLRSRRR